MHLFHNTAEVRELIDRFSVIAYLKRNLNSTVEIDNFQLCIRRCNKNYDKKPNCSYSKWHN